jgi:ribonuclease T2
LVPGKIALLEAISKTGSITEAARLMNMATGRLRSASGFVGFGEGLKMTNLVVRLGLAGALFVALLSNARSEPARENDAGQFDFYVLSLSWSPSFCAAAAERGNPRGPTPQCGPRPYSFVVHGLWPQYDKGFPEYCEVPAPRLNRAIVSSMLDLMPAPRLIYNEWDRHGTCSGLAAQAYFDTVRKAREAIKIPPQYSDLQEPLIVTFKANPGLSASSMAVECHKKQLTEVRICLSKELQFRDCSEIARRSCRRDQLVIPPMR